MILTEWKEYSNMDWDVVSKLMRKPAWIFDTRSILDMNEVKENGINIWQVGCGA